MLIYEHEAIYRLMRFAGVLSLFFLIALLIAAIIVRAFVLSITWDEAYMVCVYAAEGQKIFSPKDFLSTNHIFHTILVWFMFQAASWQEGMLRLPSVLAGIGTILLLWRLGFFLFGTETNSIKYRNTFFLIAIISLHPLIFQFFSFARGYCLSLFFSFLGFYFLLRFLHWNFSRNFSLDNSNSDRNFLLVAGISFGLSVASNLAAVFINSAIICTMLLLWFRFGFAKRNTVLTIILWFCLPGIAIVGVLYAPVFLYVSMGQFDYATSSPLDGLLDPISWTLGNTIIVPPESITRLLFGIPIPEELFWILITFIPFLVLLPVLLTALIIAGSLIRLRTAVLRPNDLAILLVLGGLLGYTMILLIAWNFGKILFPKDRTGLLPIAYSLMLPVLLLQYLGTDYRFRFGQQIRRILITGIILTLLHFLGLFSYPYYHNLWYADADIRNMMARVYELSKTQEPPKMLIFASANQTSIEFYMKKYGIRNLQLCCILKKESVDDLTRFPSPTLFILPEEAEASIRRQSTSFRIFQRNRYVGLILAESRQ
ncbi:MAG: hypothetical protein LBE12_09440 [Planctomycetaceae bacterium]|jgi:hypothetical protein|nr:hypothetical protein [Planctomycetaceae bacterium]